ncbi:hypothetical protein Aple_010400 [Acrocarpospora pleiomorpha]|uniref:Uncharacterized protein n=1 Tax=Acrocarpospora pleiomorpha TaxID=90975 RepID=A0A5M3X8V3_9ACTN|nr:hypothetical protein [Acrocarpospora pleiomorpha]GES18145.1 hypothetical protein Aple_010400 [Acrocarpospora pleiomorpha]
MPISMALITIRDPRAKELELFVDGEHGAIELRLFLSEDGGQGIYVALRGHRSDRAAEAAAMDRLAELATEAAVHLRGGATATAPTRPGPTHGPAAEGT